MSKEKYIFGPVPSRRLGLSLGVDIIPLKTCTQNCLYCQLGMDCIQTLERKVYIPINDVMAELKQRIETGLKADYITISGSGEPTLHSDLGNLIDQIHSLTHIPVAVITNGSLLWKEDVRNDCSKADLVVPSLDAGDEATFHQINKPHNIINFHLFIDGLCLFRKQYKGPIWLEVFFCEGINTSLQSIKNICKLIERIKPDKVQLNTAVRPTTDKSIHALSPDKMQEIAESLGHNSEVIADFQCYKKGTLTVNSGSVLELLKRRPCNIQDLCAGLNAGQKDLEMLLADLLSSGDIIEHQRHGKIFYTIKDQQKTP